MHLSEKGILFHQQQARNYHRSRTHSIVYWQGWRPGLTGNGAHRLWPSFAGLPVLPGLPGLLARRRKRLRPATDTASAAFHWQTRAGAEVQGHRPHTHALTGCMTMLRLAAQQALLGLAPRGQGQTADGESLANDFGDDSPLCPHTSHRSKVTRQLVILQST
jgi:hypothetical protein